MLRTECDSLGDKREEAEVITRSSVHVVLDVGWEVDMLNEIG